MPLQSPYPRIDIPECNILSYLFAGGRLKANKPIWTSARNIKYSLTSCEAMVYIKRLAVGLEMTGIQPGQAVMVFSPNHIFVPVAYLAAAGSKRIFTGINPTYTAYEVAHQLAVTDCAILFVHPDLLDTALVAAKKAGLDLDRIFTFSEEDAPRSTLVRDWRAMLGSVKDAENWTWDPLGSAAKTTIATINFSSGTTGLPKGVCVTHHNLVANVSQAIVGEFHGTPFNENEETSETWLAFLPIYHAYSQLFTVNIALRLQISVYIMEKFIFQDFLRYIEKYRITALQGVPPVLNMLNKRPESNQYDLRSLKLIRSAAAPLSAELQNEVSQKFNLQVSQMWGMTETTCLGAMIPGRTKDRTGSVGTLLPNTETMLVDESGKEITTEGMPGELLIRGPQIMLGYWRNEKATRECHTNGYFRTGDVAITRDGKLWIVERKKELIKVNGLQVAPAELEALLLTNENVADAAVVGIQIHGEEYPRAYITLQEHAKRRVSEADIQSYVRVRAAKHKHLKGGIKIIDSVPRLPSGKVARKMIRDWAMRDAADIKRGVTARL